MPESANMRTAEGDLPGQGDSGRFCIRLGKFVVETIKSVSGLPYGFETVESGPASSLGQLAASRTTHETGPGVVTLTRGADKSQALTDWVKQTLVAQEPDEARTAMTITRYDDHNAVTRRYHLTSAFAVKWEGGNLDNQAPTAAETVTIAYEQLSVE